MPRRAAHIFVALAVLAVFLVDVSGLALHIHVAAAHPGESSSAHRAHDTLAVSGNHGESQTPQAPAHEDTHGPCRTCRHLIAMTLDLPVAPSAVAVAATPVAAAAIPPVLQWTFHLPDHRRARAPPSAS